MRVCGEREMFEYIVDVVFKVFYYLKIYKNNFYFIFKKYFLYHHDKKSKNIKKIKKIRFFKNTNFNRAPKRTLMDCFHASPFDPTISGLVGSRLHPLSP